jgi:hypothetical protein
MWKWLEKPRKRVLPIHFGFLTEIQTEIFTILNVQEDSHDSKNTKHDSLLKTDSREIFLWNCAPIEDQIPN